MKKNWLYILIIMMLISISACEKESDEKGIIEPDRTENNNTENTNKEETDDPSAPPSTPDPDECKTVVLPNNGGDITLSNKDGNIVYVSFKDNLIQGGYRENRGGARFSDLGESPNLGSVKWKTPNQWMHSDIAQVGHGYAMKVNMDYKFTDATYIRLFITKAIKGVDGSISGIEIKYEYDWKEPYSNTPVDFDTSEILYTSYISTTKKEYRIIRIPFLNPIIATKIQHDEKDYIRVESTTNALFVCLDKDYVSNNGREKDWEVTVSVSTTKNTKSITLNPRVKYYDSYFPHPFSF